MTNNSRSQNSIEIWKILISSFVGAILALCASFFLYNHEKNVELEGSATILYHDIEHSITSLELALNLIEEKQVIYNRHSNLINDSDFRKLIIELRSKLDSKQIKKLLTYYGNIELLENARVKYWSGNDENEINHAYEYYRNLLEIINYQTSEQKIADAFEEVKKYSVFKEDNRPN